MKTKIISLFTCFVMLSSGLTNAQKFQGQSNFTVGTSLSLSGLILEFAKDGLNANSDIIVKSIPAINVMYDYGFADVFSLGAAFHYQQWTAEYTGYINSTSDTIEGNFKDKLSRMNFGIRPLFHFGNNDDLDMYAGARIGFTQWGYYSDSRNDKSASDIFTGSLVRFQALFGMRYFFTENIGFNLEFSLGAPYYAMAGFNFRFGGGGGSRGGGTQ